MSTREIANQQYQLFLERYGAVRGSPKLPGWSIFTDQKKNKLIQCTVANTPPTAIQWDDSNSTFQVAEAKADLPVTWVTYYGAQTYSQWFGGQLPNASQHEYACSAGTGSTQPWAGNISEIGNYAHVRGPGWQKAASDWNRNKDSKVPPLPVEPIGAVADYEDPENRILDPNTIVLTSAVHNSPWPVADTAKANAWVLDELALSYLESGGFWSHEPLIAVEESLYGEQCLVVVEGNRRLAALIALKQTSEGRPISQKWSSMLHINFSLYPSISSVILFVAPQTGVLHR